MNTKFLYSLKNIPHKLVGERVALKGRIKLIRDLGKIIFLIVSDADSLIQVTLLGDKVDQKSSICLNATIYCAGLLCWRDKNKVDTKTPNGTLEIIADLCFIQDNEVFIENNKIEDHLRLSKLLELARRTLFSYDFTEIITDDFLSYRSADLDKEKVGEPPLYCDCDTTKFIGSFGLSKFFFTEISSENLNHSTQKKIHASLNVHSFQELKKLSQAILNPLFLANNIQLNSTILSLFQEKAISTYGTETPDLRYSNQLVTANFLLKEIGGLQKFYEKIWYINISLDHYYNLQFLVDVQTALFGNASIRYTWGKFHKGSHLRGPLTKVLAVELCRNLKENGMLMDNSLLLMFFCKKKEDIFVLGYILSILNKNRKENHWEKTKLCWINSSKNFSHVDIKSPKISHLMYNGKKIAEIKISFPAMSNIYFLHDAPMYNFAQGELSINLSSLLLGIYEQPSPSRAEKEIQDLITLATQTALKEKHICEFNFTMTLKEMGKDSELLIEPLIKELELSEANERASLFKNKDPSTHTSEKSLKIILAEFGMSWDNTQYLITLLPSKRNYIEGLSPAEQFCLFWSILGHFYVQEILNSPESREILEFLVSYNVIKEHKQILFFQKSILYDIEKILSSYVKEFTKKRKQEIKHNDFYAAIKIIKFVLGSYPNHFSNFISYLSLALSKGSKINFKEIQEALPRVFKEGFTTPTLITFFFNKKNTSHEIKYLRYALDSYGEIFFTNSPVESKNIKEHIDREILDKFKEYKLNNSMIVAELIYYFFNPINMDSEAIYNLLPKIKDCSHHFNLSGIKFGGDNWDPLSGSFQFSEPGSLSDTNRLQIFPSKNIASFFAKASAGICTARDIDLFHRPDHFHLNLVDPIEKKIVGNTQIYLIKEDKKSMLLLRGLNPSSSFVNSGNCAFIVNSILLSAIQIAKHSGISNVLICPSLGIWRVESSRVEIISVLKNLTQNMALRKLENPFFLFRFSNQDKFIDHAYEVWNYRYDSQLDTISYKKVI